MRIGAIEIQTGASLAPMAGVTDTAMRRICAAYGASFTVSEMVSAKALTMNDKKSYEMLRGGGGDIPYGVQLFGHEPKVLFKAVQLLESETFDFLDINMGCPAPKIVNPGAGSALLKNPKLAEEMAQAAVKASKRPVTVKLRLGWDDTTRTGLEIAKRCEAAGVTLLAVHGRTRAQQYTPGVDFDAVAAIKQAVKVPVLFNGDIASAEDAKSALGKTGCDGAMVGRAAMGNPWLFSQIKAVLEGNPPPQLPTMEQRFAVMKQQIRAMCDEKGEEHAMREARGVAAAYVRGLRGAASLRRQAHSLTYFADLDALMAQAFEYQLAPESDMETLAE